MRISVLYSARFEILHSDYPQNPYRHSPSPEPYVPTTQQSFAPTWMPIGKANTKRFENHQLLRWHSDRDYREPETRIDLLNTIERVDEVL